MSAGSFLIAVSPQYDGSVLKCSSRPSIFHLPSHGSRCSAGFPDTGAEKGASSGRNRERNTRQPTSLPAVVSDTRPDLHLPPSRGRRKGSRREGCGEPRSDDEPSQVPALLPHSQLLLPSVPARPLHSHHHVLYRFDGYFVRWRMLCPVPM